MNSAAHGSQVADTLATIVAGLDTSPGACRTWPEVARPLCEWAAVQSTQPTEFLLNTIAFAMAIPVDALERFIEAEDGIVASPTLADFLRNHLPGIRSLSTGEAERFWSEDAPRLPTNVLYTSFRAVITDRWRNLPLSNALFYDLLRRAGDTNPHNDMQVLLSGQTLGGPVADREVILPVAEGNHWQWELNDGAVPENVMPARMSRGVPRDALMVAYFQTLAELSLME
jgi:hypothetical protein